MHNQTSLIPEARDIEELSQKFALEFINKHKVEADINDIQAVRMSSIQNREVREIGGESLGVSFFNRLELSGCLKSCGFTKRQIEIAILLIIGRLVSPGSERHLHTWAKHLSGLGEIIKTDFSRLSLNSLYKVSDLLYEHKDEIEAHLRVKEKDLFGLDEAIILYDLTNTYFEGQALSNPKAKFGRSKEKRSDAKLLTLGMVIDSQGFPKTSRIFSGNQSEPETLLNMVNTLYQQDPTSNVKPTVIIDAGIATEKNLEKLRDHFHYIAVSRKKLDPPELDDCIVIKEDKQNKVEAKRLTRGKEVFLYCRSNLKEQRSDAHIFITLLAYHLLHSIRSSLKQQGINLSWQTIRKRMSTHCCLTNRLVTKEGHTLFVRKCSEPEDFHQTIYDTLAINSMPVKEKRYIVKICSDP